MASRRSTEPGASPGTAKSSARGHTVEVSPDGRLCALDRPQARRRDHTLRLSRRRRSSSGSPHREGLAFRRPCRFRQRRNPGSTPPRAVTATRPGRIAPFTASRTRPGSGAFSSGGIEPHELIWGRARSRAGYRQWRSRRSLGDRWRSPISSLAFVDAESGALQSALRLDEDLISLSIRHLARTRGGEIVFGMQDQDRRQTGVHWSGVARLDGTIALLDMPSHALMKLRGYCGQRRHRSGGRHRRGHLAPGRIRPHSGMCPSVTISAGVELRDRLRASPLRNRPEQFVFTSGSGTRVLIDAADGVTSRVLEQPADGLPLWDNHLTAMPQ